MLTSVSKLLLLHETIHAKLLQRIIVKTFLYPAVTEPPASLYFSDRFAFRPIVSTTAALIAVLHSITGMLSSNPCICPADRFQGPGETRVGTPAAPPAQLCQLQPVPVGIQKGTFLYRDCTTGGPGRSLHGG